MSAESRGGEGGELAQAETNLAEARRLIQAANKISSEKQERATNVAAQARRM